MWSDPLTTYCTDKKRRKEKQQHPIGEENGSTTNNGREREHHHADGGGEGSTTQRGPCSSLPPLGGWCCRSTPPFVFCCSSPSLFCFSSSQCGCVPLFPLGWYCLPLLFWSGAAVSLLLCLVVLSNFQKIPQLGFFDHFIQCNDLSKNIRQHQGGEEESSTTQKG